MANTLTFAGQTISDDHIFGGVSYLADLNTGEEFTIGNTASASISFVTDIRLPLYSKDPVNGTSRWVSDGDHDFADSNDDLIVTEADEVLTFGDGRGRFYITEVTKEAGMYTITAYDAMILLDTNISALSLTFPLTVSAAASAIATYIGCTVSGTVNNGTLSVDELNEDMTIRELLGYVAEASGCSVKIDGYDHLCFMYYEDSDITVTASEYVSLEVADYVCAAIDNVTILNSVGAAVATVGSGTNTLYIEANPFLEEATATEAALILSLVEDFEYAPVTCELFETGDIEIGTIVTFGETPSLVMHIDSSESGATASSVGSDTRAEYNKSFETMLAAATKEALDAAEEASTKATKYITKIDNAGIKVHAYNDSTATPDSSNYAKINGEGLEVYKSGDSVAKFGTSVRVGLNGTSHVEIGSDNGMNVFDQDGLVRLNASGTGISIFDYEEGNPDRINVAQFTKTARVGPNNDYNVYVDNTGIAFREATTSRFKINSAIEGYYIVAKLVSTAARGVARFITKISNDNIVGNLSSCTMEAVAPDGSSMPNAQVEVSRKDNSANVYIGSRYSNSVASSIEMASGSSSNIISMTADKVSLNASEVSLGGVLKTGSNKFLTIDTVTIDNISIAAGATAIDQTVSATKTGYTPIGVIGFLIANATSSGANSTVCNLFQCRLLGNDFVCSIRNNSTSVSAKVRVIANILYIASTQGV